MTAALAAAVTRRPRSDPRQSAARRREQRHIQRCRRAVAASRAAAALRASHSLKES